MPDSTSNRPTPPIEAPAFPEGGTGPVSGLTARVDPPHQIYPTGGSPGWGAGTPHPAAVLPTADGTQPGAQKASPPPGSELASNAAGEAPTSLSPDLSPERLRKHARQLADYLRRRQQDLDRRESRLNAQLAQLENDIRAMRLLWTERHAEWEEKRQLLADRELTLARRRAELGEHEEAIQQREQVLAQWEDSLRRKEVDLARRERELQEQRRELVQREAALRFREEDFSALAVLLEPVAAQSAEQSATDTVYLDQVTRALSEEEKQLRQLLQRAESVLAELVASRRRWQEEERRWRHQWAVEQREHWAELASEQEAVARRARAVEQSRQQVLRLKEEVAIKHREALAHHLAACEVLAELAAERPSAEIVEKLEVVRRAWKETLNEAETTQQQRLRELRELGQQMQQFHARLQEEKRRFDEYLEKHITDLNDRAERLAQREQELALKQAEIEEHGRRFRLDELHYQDEIQRLRQRLREFVPEVGMQSGTEGASVIIRATNGVSTTKAP